MAVPGKLTIPEIVEQFARYYQQPQNGAWGSLHVVLDDHNVDDESVEHCQEWATKRGDTEGAELAGLLLRMSQTQRAKLPHIVRTFLRAHPVPPQGR